MSAVTIWQGCLPPVNEKEALRYAGVKEAAPEVLTLLHECMLLCNEKISPRVCYAVYPVCAMEEQMDLGFARVDSHSLRRNLAGCDEIVLFAATIGLEIDRLIARYAHLSPARSVMLQAIGTERIEALCDAFENHLIARGCKLRPRFSPGYGDLPLALQRELFAALDCPKHIGVSLNQSLLMSPGKSVTAMIGLMKEEC